MDEGQYAELRRNMVERQIKTRGIDDPEVIRSMLTVPRHYFVPDSIKPIAYEDSPLLIGGGQTISQPYIVALMSQAAKCDSSSKVLDIGTGSGYAAAVFSLIAKEVYTIERIQNLSEQAQKCFKELGYLNIHAIIGDGSLGWAENAPFDAIVVTAGAPVVPQALLDQLVVGGRLIIPVGDSGYQRLYRYIKREDGTFDEEKIEYVRFVPLIGEQGWKYE